MKMKKLVKSSVASSIALLLLSNTVDAAQHITPVSEKKVDDKITLYKTTATSDNDKLNISQILTFNFIKDKSYDKDTLVLKAAGNIKFRIIKSLIQKIRYFSSLLRHSKCSVAFRIK